MKIPEKSVSYWTRWFCLPVVLLGVLAAFFVVVWYCTRIPVFNLWWQAGIGFMCAIGWMALAFVLAPEHKIAGAFGCLLLGALLAWVIIGKTFWPDYSGMTRLPTYITWMGGVLSWLGIIVSEKMRKLNNTPDGICQPADGMPKPSV